MIQAFSCLALGQELEPRAYASAPIGFHAFAAGYSRSGGSVLFDPAIPIKDVTADINGVVVGYFQSLGFFNRYANLTLVVPYAWGPIQGLVEEEFTRITRSGLGDPRLRFAVNLHGAPALKPQEFAQYRQSTNIGVSFSLSAPMGQYDPAKLINLGSNRWAFKPEVGVSHVRGRWLFECGAGVWLLGANDAFLGTSKREQDPIASFQGHIIYNLPRRMWIGFDANFFRGGQVRLDGEKASSPALRNSRFGMTFSIPFHRRHSFKVSYDNGLITRLGTDFSRISISYQIIWLGM